MKKTAKEIKEGDVVTWVGAFRDYVVIDDAARDPDYRKKVCFRVHRPRGLMGCRLFADQEVEIRSIAPDLPFAASEEHPIPWSVESYSSGKLMVSDGNGNVVAIVACTGDEEYRGIQKRVNRVNDHDRRGADFRRWVENTCGWDKVKEIEAHDVWMNGAKAEAEEKDARIEHLEAYNQSLRGEVDDLQNSLDAANTHAHSIVEATEAEQEGDGN